MLQGTVGAQNEAPHGSQDSPTGHADDLTAQFAKAVSRARRVAGKPRPKGDILQPRRPAPSQWTRESGGILLELEALSDFLDSHLAGYLGIHRFGGSTVDDNHVLSPSQREQVDQHGIATVKACSKRIQALKHKIKHQSPDDESSNLAPHVRLHREAVVAYLYERVQGLAQLLQELRAVRLKQAQADVQRLSSARSSQRRRAAGASQSSSLGGVRESGGDNSATIALSEAAPATMSWLDDDLHEFVAPSADEELMVRIHAMLVCGFPAWFNGAPGS